MAVTDRLLPKVRSVHERDGTFSLPEPIVIAAGVPASEATLRTARTLDADLRCRTGHAVEISDDPNRGSILLRVQPGPDAEAYRLAVTPAGITITGQGEAGLFYGTRTLVQLIEDGQVPCCEITDSPDYKHRMVMYDLARENTCNMRHLKHVIDILSDHKVNMLHLYLENRFQFAKHPEVSPPGVMTPAQARELEDYAASRFMTIVPEVNCLAHLENALSVERYRRLSEDPNVPWEICTTNPESVRFVEDLVREVAGAFRSPYFHMGGDESNQMGHCPKCAERVKQDGGKQKLFADHFTHMDEFIKSIGKRPMMWGDMLLENQGAAEAMPKDIIIFDWHYGDTTVDTVRYFTSQGFEVYVCPAMSGFSRLAAPYAHATGNIYKFIGEGKEGGAIGECTCAWELRLGHLFANDYWGILLSADRSWNLSAGDLADYEKRFCKAFFGLDDPRPVQYYQQLSDGYASIFEHVVPRKSLIAFSDRLLDRAHDYGTAMTPEMLAASDAQLKKLTSMLDDLRASAKRNKDALEFADVPAHSAHMMLVKLAFYLQADALIRDAQSEIEADHKAADSKLLRAIGLLEEIDKEAGYFEPRFRGIVERYGGSEEDVARVARLRAALAARIADGTIAAEPEPDKLTINPSALRVISEVEDIWSRCSRGVKDGLSDASAPVNRPQGWRRDPGTRKAGA